VLAERDALLPILRAGPAADLDRPTCLPGWSVRAVIAHCAAALSMTATQTWHGFSPEENQVDVDERADWPVAKLLDELEAGYQSAAPIIAAADGKLDGLALGEWLHGGDVREALDRPDAYASPGAEDALVLLVERFGRRDSVPRTAVTLADGRELVIRPEGGPATASMHADVATLFRLSAARRVDQQRLRLTGADPSAYNVFS